MALNFTRSQKEELEKIGNLYRKTIYNPLLTNLPNIVKDFGDGLMDIKGDISSDIVGETCRFYKLITSNYHSQIRKTIDGLHKILSKKLPNNISFYISCRQKSWESTLRKCLKHSIEGRSVYLYDLIALRIIIDSILPEDQLEVICHNIYNICYDFFVTNKCTIMPPSKLVDNNPLYKDYIAHPKPNGYKSIHFAIMDINNTIFEVQIRTQLMDANSEFDLNMDTKNKLAHTEYKHNEYEAIIPYIYFDPQKANNIPFFKFYKIWDQKNKKEKIVIVDKIGLMTAKPIEERARTF